MAVRGSGASLPAELRQRAERARVARLATIRPDGRPHVVPITFAIVANTLIWAIDHKPKRTTDLQRLRNIELNPAVSVLVDAYDEDWSQLWWVRLDGVATVVRGEPDRSTTCEPLLTKYGEYRVQPPSGPIVRIAVASFSWWSAADPRDS